MDPISAIGLAGNIVQFIDFGSKVAARLYEFQQARGEVPKVFRGISIRLPLLIEDLKICNSTNVHISPGSKIALEQVIKSCRKQVEELNAILDETLPAEDDSWRAGSFKAIASLRKEKEVERIEKEMRRCVEVLTLHHVLPRAESLKKIDSDEVTLVASVMEDERKEAFFEVPRRSVSRFVGRENVILDMNAKFQDSPVVVLQAMGGQGKTQTALEYCRRWHENKYYSGIFWVDAASEIQLRRSFEAIAEAIKPPGRIFDNSDQSIAYVKQSLETRIQPWLLVLDNHDDPVGFPNAMDFLPPGNGGHVLFTTRHLDVCRYGASIALPGMPEAESLDLFFHRSTCERTPDTIEHVKQIVHRLGYHPLALDQAAAYINKRKRTLPLENFVDHYKRRKKDILKSTPKVWEYRRKQDEDDREVSLSVFTTWELSFERFVEESEFAEEYSSFLSLLGFFHNADISGSMFAEFWEARHETEVCPQWMETFTDGGMWSQDRFQDALVELCDLSLIEAQFKDSQGIVHVSLHPLVKDWIQMRATNEERYQQCLLQASILGALFEPARWFSAEEVQAAFSHLAVMEENIHESIQPYLRHENLNQLAGATAMASRFLENFGKFSDAERLLQRALDWQTQSTDPQDPLILDMKGRKGELLGCQSRFREAEIMFREVEEAHAARQTGDTPNRIRNLINIAEVLSDQVKYEESEKRYREVIARAKDSPELRFNYLLSRNNLAFVLRRRNKFEEAERIYRDLIAIREAEAGFEHPDTLMNYSNLAIVLSDMGKLKESVEINQRCYSTGLRTHGAYHPWTLLSGSNLGIQLYDVGRAEEAEGLLRKVLSQAERVFGRDHPRVMHTLDSLALVLLQQGRIHEALEAAERAVLNRGIILDHAHPTLLRSQSTLARILQAHGRLHEAERILRTVLTELERIFGKGSIFPLEVRYDYGCVLRDLYNGEEAKEFFQSLWMTSEEALGKNHPRTLLASVEYAISLEPQVRGQEARNVLLNATHGLHNSLDPGHPIFDRIAVADLALQSGIGGRDAETPNISELRY